MTAVVISPDSTAARALYFVDRLLRLRALERLVPLAAAAASADPVDVRLAKEKLAELHHEVKELQGRLGFSVRRQVNERLRALGLPEVRR